jgi:hypothetical protein
MYAVAQPRSKVRWTHSRLELLGRPTSSRGATTREVLSMTRGGAAALAMDSLATVRHIKRTCSLLAIRSPETTRVRRQASTTSWSHSHPQQIHKERGGHGGETGGPCSCLLVAPSIEWGSPRRSLMCSAFLEMVVYCTVTAAAAARHGETPQQLIYLWLSILLGVGSRRWQHWRGLLISKGVGCI